MAQVRDGQWVISPQDVVAQFECGHKVSLDAAVSAGALEWTGPVDPGLDLLRAQGLGHERARLDGLDPAWRVAHLRPPGFGIDAYEAAWQATREAMAEEVDAIYQATLFTGDFVGIADFLILARDHDGAIVREADGRAVYEPVDTKSARSAKRGAVLQVGCYAEALVRLGCPAPRQVHLWLAGDADWHGPADEFIALARSVREHVQSRLPQLGLVPSPVWAAPCQACNQCRWVSTCEAGRREARDLSLVQGIRGATRQRLVDHGIATIDSLAAATELDRPARVAAQTFTRLQAQSSLQVRAEREAKVLWEVVDEAVLAELPPRSSGDLWFDMEGDPYADGGQGLEYMFGFGFLASGAFDFDTTEAHDRLEERGAFEAFVDLVMQRRAADPGMHVYHYADYERRALLTLAQRHGTREDEVDLLLREGRLVDLYKIVRRGLRLSTRSLSLKDVEAVYDMSHKSGDVTTAMDSVIQYERFVALTSSGKADEANAVLASIRDYNKLDCESTMHLDDWLRTLSPTKATVPVPTLARDEDSMPSTASDPHAALITELEAGLPSTEDQWTPTERARALLSAALQFHPRERRPAWWTLFDLIKADRGDLERATDVLVVDGATDSGWSKPPRARKERRELFLTSEHEDPRSVLSAGSSGFLLYEHAPDGVMTPADSTRGYHSADIDAVDADTATISERSGRDGQTWDDTPIAVLPGAPPDAGSIRQALADAARSMLPEPGQPWELPPRAWVDLLMARNPRTTRGTLPRHGDGVDDIVAALRDSNSSYVAVQGPPGTGKTFVGSRAVAQLAAAGWRIGVVAQSHAVVDNFLKAVHAADSDVAVGKEPSGSTGTREPWHIAAKIDAWAMGQPGGYVLGGTAWTLTRQAVRALGLDLLVIDEAGQFALANAVACAGSAERVLLLGDPQQLPQVSQATHPMGIEVSVLEHLAQGHPTLPPERGYFLEKTYRMHPQLTEPVSRLQYEGRLRAAPVTLMRTLDGLTPGLGPIAVEHTGNSTSSPEEAQEVLQIVGDLIGRTWTGARNDSRDAPRRLNEADIIVVAAYNAQVRLLRRTLADAGYPNIQVGTVDRFQGREAVIAIVSMATSSDEDLPRGIEFLLSPNRLNVAISRAQWAGLLIFSPALLQSTPTSVDAMRRLGGFIKLVSRR